MAAVLALVATMGVACQDEGPPDEVEAVVAAMEDEGIECTDLETTTEFGPESDADVVERGFCVVGSDRVVISIFDDETERDEWVGQGDLAGKVAVGPTWVVGSDSQSLVEDVAGALDGTIPSD